jgi:hypothetical protein
MRAPAEVMNSLGDRLIGLVGRVPEEAEPSNMRGWKIPAKDAAGDTIPQASQLPDGQRLSVEELDAMMRTVDPELSRGQKEKLRALFVGKLRNLCICIETSWGQPIMCPPMKSQLGMQNPFTLHPTKHQ